jgi:hypothetical protein
MSIIFQQTKKHDAAGALGIDAGTPQEPLGDEEYC